MIITKLMGGLGNQMFQYAVGRRLAHIHKTEIKLDLSVFKTDQHRSYSLHNFNIIENIATPKEIKSVCNQRLTNIESITKRFYSIKPRKKQTHIQEKESFFFDREILNLPNGIYFDGYWQSEKYFADIKRLILREFTVKTPQSGGNKKLSEKIASVESVSLHVRRGDYVTSPSACEILGTLNWEYYQKCITCLSDLLTEPHYFIFSDEPEWVINNIKLQYPMTIIDNNGVEKSFEDLRLMSQCKFHIIANSSFSWWGAWLNPRKNKIVLVPKTWHADKNREVRDLIPNEWLKI